MFNGCLGCCYTLEFHTEEAKKKREGNALCLRNANDVYMKITCCVICFDNMSFVCCMNYGLCICVVTNSYFLFSRVRTLFIRILTLAFKLLSLDK